MIHAVYSGIGFTEQFAPGTEINRGGALDFADSFVDEQIHFSIRFAVVDDS